MGKRMALPHMVTLLAIIVGLLVLAAGASVAVVELPVWVGHEMRR